MSQGPMNDVELRLAIKFLRYRAGVGSAVLVSRAFATQIADHLEADLTPTAERKSA